VQTDPAEAAGKHAAEWLNGLAERKISPNASVDELRAAFGHGLPEGSADPATVIAELAEDAGPGLLATASPRFFGFVVGGSLPVAVAADWLTTAWDQNAGLFALSPAASVVEEVVGAWLIDLFGLPESASFGFVTGAQMANFTALAAARNHVLAGAGWDVEADGLTGAPPIDVILGEEHHATIAVALRYLGLGTSSARLVRADGQGRMQAEGFREAVSHARGPTIVCAQAGNVNTGAFDPLGAICDAAHEKGAWVHVDGAFGLWATTAPSLRPLVDGLERADSWAVDGHKWLNVPYDSGFVFSAHREPHRSALTMHASYLVKSEGDRERDPADWAPEASRRARAFTVYAALKSLGRTGVAEMIERCCACARRFADALGREPGVEVLNDVVLNQVLVRFLDPEGGDHDARTRAVLHAVQEDGTCWPSGSVWKDKAVIRISVSNWATTFEDVDRSVEAIMRAAYKPA